jgi:hypothetical protein
MWKESIRASNRPVLSHLLDFRRHACSPTTFILLRIHKVASLTLHLQTVLGVTIVIIAR